MHSFRYHHGTLHCEDVDLVGVAEKFGTPTYVYSAGTILDHYTRLDAALASLDHLICYAVKANSNRAILKLLADAGAGFDIVSGGELSRVALALKVVLSRADQTPALIFDEVDSGIGGEAAIVVGRQLKAVSKGHQVLCITHLPQIASFADRHLRVDKVIRDGRAITTVECVEDSQRIQEIARMLGGERVTPAALQHAEQMLYRQNSNTPAMKREKPR